MSTDFLTLEDAASIANRDPSTIRHAARRGALKATKFGRAWLITRADLEAWMQSSAYNSNKGPKRNSEQFHDKTA